MSNPIIVADEFATKVCELYGLDPKEVRRVVIDAQAGSVLRVYFDTFGTEELLALVSHLPSVEEGTQRFISIDDRTENE